MEKSRFVFRRALLLVLGFSFALSTACSSRPCREPRLPELDKTKTAREASTEESAELAATGNSTENSQSPSKVSSTPTANEIGRRTRVYKPDGTRQCERRAGISLEAMERELAGIVVHNREKRRDGLMHIQVCGGPTGMINLYEIDANFTKQAEQRGFKRLED